MQMATFDQRGAAISFVQIPGGTAQIFRRADSPAYQDFGFGNVRCDENSQWEQPRTKAADTFALEQPFAAGRNHNRIDYQRHAVVFEEISYHPNNPAGVKHSRFCGSRRKFAENSFKLAAYHCSAA